MTAPPSPRAVLAQLQSYVANPPTEISNDDNLRRELYTASRKLQLQLEETPTTMLRLTIGHAAEKAVLRIAFDLGLLPYIAEEGSPKTLHDIKTHIKADEVLLLRVLRALAAAGTILEVGEDAYTLASNCRLFGDQSFIDAARDCEDIVTQVFDAMPEFLASTGYRNPTDRRNGPANKAVNQPDADLFELMRTKFPEKSSSFGHFLGSFTQDSAKPHEIYPVKDRLIHGLESEAQSYAWIDVGGGMGLYTAALQNAYPELAGRCVVQEQEMMLAVAKNRGADKRVEFMAHDFLTEQPLKGARAYYFRNIFHNWGDKESKLILERTRDAMKPGYSRLLIQDLVIAERGADQSEATQDWLMLMGYCAHERSERQWHELLALAGLRISNVYQNKGGYPIIEAEVVA